MQHTIQITSSYIYRTKELMDFIKAMLKKYLNKDKVYIVDEINQKGYLRHFKNRTADVEVLEQTKNYMVLKCKR